MAKYTNKKLFWRSEIKNRIRAIRWPEWELERAAAFARAYRQEQELLGGDTPPCVCCPDKVIYFCKETETECRIFRKYVEDERIDYDKYELEGEAEHAARKLARRERREIGKTSTPKPVLRHEVLDDVIEEE